jgi:hypothetical protein
MERERKIRTRENEVHEKRDRRHKREGELR